MAIGKNIYQKRILALIAVLILVLGGGLSAMAISGLGDAHSGQLVNTVGVRSDIGYVYGINGTSHNSTYELATLTNGTSSNSIVATFADGFNATHIIVFEKNPQYDIAGILNRSLYYSTLNVGLSEKNSTGVTVPLTMNLSSVTEAFGYEVNDTSTHNINDKNIIPANTYSSINVFGNGVNKLNQTIAFNLFGLGSANYNNLYGIVINLNGTVSTTNQIAVDITQSFGAPFNVNLIQVFSDIFIVESILAVALVLMGMPRINKGGY